MKNEKHVKRLKVLFVSGIVVGVIFGIGLTLLAARGVVQDQKEIVSQTEAEMEKLKTENKELKDKVSRKEAAHNNAGILKGTSDDWATALINETHPLDTSYVPELKEIDDERSVDARIYDSLKKMLDDAAAQGLSMYVASGYRSYETQRDVFERTMRDWLNQGYSPLGAYDETKKSVAVPGTSEHASGLAVDIISSTYTGLDDKQGDTEEQKWLMEHCWEYGFVLRYPQDKAEVTGIIFEPWHYRYVGKDAAKEMKEKNLTLEEYIGE